MTANIRALRLQNQGLSPPRFRSPQDAVHILGAVQAQDYLAALWALGARLPGATESSIEEAVASASIVRTWPLRCTLHFVAPEDARWILQHLGPRVMSSLRGRYRRLELEDADFGRAGDIVERALEGGRCLARPALYGMLEDAGLSTAGQRGIHILQRLALECLICCGPRQGKQHTFVLMDEWLPPTPEIDREDALARLAGAYFTSRGPATVRDFAWWSGLSLGDARTAVEMAGGSLAAVTIDGSDYVAGAAPELLHGRDESCHLLPAFDEYLVAYTDRGALLDSTDKRAVNNGGGLLGPTLVIGGRVVGTWKRAAGPKHRMLVSVTTFAAFTPKDADAVRGAAKRYADFLGQPVDLTIDGG